MLLHMRSVLSKGEQPRFIRTMDMSRLLQDRKEIASHGPLHIDLQAKPSSGSVTVDGQLKLEAEFVCSRCLALAGQQLDIPFHEVFTPQSDASEDENDNDEEEDHIHPVTEDKVDLTPYVEENVLLALPYVPLCSEQCKGLCPVCGGNRNTADCGCKQEKIDPRLAGLADFFKD